MRWLGIDASDMLDKAKEVVALNKLEDTICLIKGKVEDVSLPEGVTSVDIIISEWMGYFLLFESMLPTVLYARDKWLSKGGVVYPDKATMYISGCNNQSYREKYIDFWKDVYGFDMSCLIKEEDKFRDCSIEVVEEKAVVTNTATLFAIDVQTVQKKQLDFSTDFNLSVTRDDMLERFVVHFDTDFRRGLDKPVTLDTGFAVPETHWRQTVFTLAKPLKVAKGDVIKGHMEAKRGKDNEREYEVSINYRLVSGGTSGAHFVQSFTIAC